MKRSTAGFTLVELLLVILCSSVVTMAAMSFLLMGMRMTGESNDTAQRQQTARIILTMVENLGGEIQSVTEDADWKITGTGGSELLAYSNAEKKITAHGMTLIDGLEEATAAMNGQLLSFTLKTGKGSYKTSVYCRTAPPKQPESGETLDPAEEAAFLTTFRSRVAEAAAANAQAARSDPAGPAPAPAVTAPTERESRLALLNILAGQHGSGGEIQNQPADAPYRYFSEWYIGGYGAGKPGWNADTPWCACFVSWAAAQLGDTYLNTVPRFCSVDDGMERFQSGSIGTWHGRGYAPTPGDCIFFDWTGGSDPAHVGVVFYVDAPAGKVYTIEGNSSDRVAIRSYALDDPCILGYGELNWKQ